ncbi:MAG: OmpA family protein [Flavobacteriales bacterium]|nr:OmpA family protein [Flavobacteriales bacterium]MCB9197687.1 OmpA family protein [Flavobacteriales bacterium]
MSKSIKQILVFGLLLLVNGASFGQLSVAEMLRYGDLAFDQKNYGSAAYFYEMVVDENLKVERVSSHPYAFSVYTGANAKPSKSDSTVTELSDKDIDYNEILATHKVAECYRLMNNYQAAHDWYVKALQLNWGNSYPEFTLDRYWYGNILMNLGKYNEAVEEFNTFLLDAPEPTEEVAYYVYRTKDLINNCKFAQSPRSKNLEVSVKKGDSLINNGSSSFGASYYESNVLLISSARSSSTSDKERKIEGNLLSDIFTIRSTGDSKWEGAMGINSPVNTSEHEGAASVGEDTKTMYYTKWYVDNTKTSEIYVTKYFVDKWMKPRLLEEAVNEKGYASQHPFITKDGKLLFFASDRPGGQGGMDIWMCEVDRNGKTSNPVNLGPNINTPEDEITPFFHEATGILYFSSKGHQNIGGFDIFKSKFNLAQKYAAKPENMGIPINSPMNDSYFILENLQTSGYFTSNRDNCNDCSASNCNQIYSFNKNENNFMLSGYVFDFETDLEIPYANITVKDVLGEFEPYTFQTDSTGYYEIPMAPEMHIFVKAQKLEYLADANVQSTIAKDKSEQFTIDFYLQLIPYEEIQIHGILYDYDKATLRPESEVALDSLIDFLTINDNLIVEISSHTDEQGSDSYNIKLSQKRAESVVNYLIEHGIPESRLVAKGYGESKPKVKNAQTEEDHQKNRRTSFRILSENFEEVNQLRPKMK